MTTRKRLLRLLAILFAVALVAAACGDDDGDSGDSAATDADDGGTDTDTPTDEADEDSVDEDEGDDGGEPAVTELSGLTVVDDLTFTVELIDPDPEFALQLNYNAYVPLPEVFFEDPAAFEESPIGNGPFQMDGNWEHDVTIETIAYPDYAGPDVPNLQELEYRIIPDNATAYVELQAGNIDAVNQVPLDALDSAPDEFGDRYEETPQTGFSFYVFPSYLDEQYPLELRRALSMALDRQLLVDTILQGTRVPAHSVVAPSLQGDEAYECANWAFDLDAAQAAFEEFGGLEALGDEPIVMWFNAGSDQDIIAEAIANQWRNNLGIDNVTFEPLEFSEYVPLLAEESVTGPSRLGWSMDYPSPYNFLAPLYLSDQAPPAGSNYAFYTNTDYDELLAQGRAAVAEGGLDAARPFFRDAEDLLCEDVPVMPLYFDLNTYAYNDTVDNVFKDAFGNFNITEIEGDSFVTNIAEPGSLAPTNSNESEGTAVLRALFKGLIDYDPETLEPFNAVAESIETTDGGQTWTITLNDGWTFHDGSPVTARSFVDAWNYGANPANAQLLSGFYANIVGYDEMNPPEEAE